MKTIRFTICLLGLIVGLSVLSFGQCQDQKCSLNTSTTCYQCVTGSGSACSPEVAACPQSCTETSCNGGAVGGKDPFPLKCPSSDPCSGTLGSLQEINLQPRLLDREFLAAIQPTSRFQCQAADLPKKILFSI
jgi:hypothetical protein